MPSTSKVVLLQAVLLSSLVFEGHAIRSNVEHLDDLEDAEESFEESGTNETSGMDGLEHFMLRRCILLQAEKWPPAASVTELKEEPVDSEGLHEKIAEYWEADDILLNRERYYGTFKKLIAKHRSHTHAELAANMSRLVSEMAHDYKFSISAAENRCKAGWTDETTDCMANLAKSHTVQVSPSDTSPLEDLVVRRIELETRHKNMLSIKKKFKDLSKPLQTLSSKLVTAIGQTRKSIKETGFSFDKARKKCKHAGSQHWTELKKALESELYAAKKAGGITGKCEELADKMCPEGTFPTTRRRIDVAKGAAAATTAFWGAQVGKVVLATAYGAASGIPAGPAGIAAGAAAGFAMGAVMPGPTAVSGAAFVWYSTGPNECACFPRSCYYDEQEGTCAIGEGAKASKNPFGRALPYGSTKCVLKRKGKHHENDKPQCVVQQCEELDYAPALNVAAEPLYGIVGKHDSGIYNCISTNAHSSGLLALQTNFPSGVNNTAASRTDLFRSMGIPEAKDHTDIEEANVPSDQEPELEESSSAEMREVKAHVADSQ